MEKDLCPECQSMHIEYHKKTIKDEETGVVNATFAECKNCGWQGKDVELMKKPPNIITEDV